MSRFYCFCFLFVFCNYFISADVFHHRRDMVTTCLSLCDMSRPLMLSTWEPGLLGWGLPCGYTILSSFFSWDASLKKNFWNTGWLSSVTGHVIKKKIKSLFESFPLFLGLKKKFPSVLQWWLISGLCLFIWCGLNLYVSNYFGCYNCSNHLILDH